MDAGGFCKGNYVRTVGTKYSERNPVRQVDKVGIYLHVDVEHLVQ